MKKLKKTKKAIVVHSGGSDSSLCLALAMREFGKEAVLSLSFHYDQRHLQELQQAEKICRQWGVDHIVLSVECLKEITESALIGNVVAIDHPEEGPANTLVLGRNGLMARLAAIHAHSLDAHCIYMGVIEDDAKIAGYRDCTRDYMDLKQKILRIDLADPAFEIRTPLVHMSKKEAFELSYRLGVLEFLLKETITCYQGIPHQGCRNCPSCKIRNTGLREFVKAHPEFKMPYPI